MAPEDDYSGSESGSNTSDDTFDDWIEEDTIPCYSLFEYQTPFPSVALALENDKTKHGFDLLDVSSKLTLDFHRRTRLINYIRKKKVPASEVKNLTGNEPFFSDDTLLLPIIEDDPMIQIDSGGDWSDDEAPPSSSKSASTGTDAKFEHLQRLVQDIVGVSNEQSGSNPSGKSTRPTESELVDGEQPERDDDTHYFESYGHNEIHAIMLSDTVRTSSYAKFILSNPSLFKDAYVMDVGCGTGILSMFAARAGAKHVFAIDASTIAEKAKRNIKDNGLEDRITVIQSKVESLSLPAPYSADPNFKVDILISEWMGYGLLYESMLDSVLHARDKWLRPPTPNGERAAGVMAPSQCKIILSLANVPDQVKEKVTFWDEVYGFKMPSMVEEAYDEAHIEIVRPEAPISNLYTIKDLPIDTIKTANLDFSSSFTLTATKDSIVHAFLLYFDTFFTPTGQAVPDSYTCTVYPPDGDLVTTDVLALTGSRKAKNIEGTTVSFSTGPQSLATHWKQTVFLLKEPFKVIEGSTVTGEFHLSKSPTNSRELDVEVHYSVSHTGLDLKTTGSTAGKARTTVQMWKLR